MVTFLTTGTYGLQLAPVRPPAVETLGNKKNKAVICFTFDDGQPADSSVHSEFLERGLKCSYALPLSAGINLQKYPEWWKQGFCMMSHSVNADPMSDPTLDPDVLAEYMIRSKKQLSHYVAPAYDIRGWVTPSSVMAENFIPLLYDKYDYAFTKAWSAGMPEWNDRNSDIYRLHRRFMPGTFAGAKTIIDNAIAARGFLVFYQHPAQMSSIDLAAMESILDYVKQCVDDGLCECMDCNSAVDFYFNSNVRTGS